MSDCLCGSIPRERSGQVLSPAGKLLDAFHMDCPTHGIVLNYEKPMRTVYRRARMTRQQLLGLMTLTACRVVQKHPDGQTAIVEYEEFEFDDTPQPEKETAA